MSGVALGSQIWSCARVQINGENAGRAQSTRTFDPDLNVVSNTYRSANEFPFGRPASQNSGNGWDGDLGGFAGLNPNDWIIHETGLRQVEFQSHYPYNTSYYDTIAGANRSQYTSQKAGSSAGVCGVMNGPQSYVNTPVVSNQNGQLTSTDRAKYQAALQAYMNNPNMHPGVKSFQQTSGGMY